MRFALLRRGLAVPLVEAFSPVLHLRNPNEPLQIHLALTAVPGYPPPHTHTHLFGQLR